MAVSRGFRCLPCSVVPLLVLGALVVPNPAQSAALATKDARLVEVTVYPDRAEVVREARIDVPAGASTIEFSDIPFAVAPDSVRVSAKGVAAVLGAVEIRSRAEEPKETPEQIALKSDVKRIETDIARLGAQDRTAAELRDFLHSLRATTATREGENLGSGRADPAAIRSVYDLLAAKLSELADQELERRAAVTRLAKELEIARAKLAAAPPSASIRSRVAAVELDAAQAGALTLRLAYLVSSASWSPSYRATLDAGSGEVALVSEGIVRQTTGEDWRGVALRLSTAAPARGIAPPEMASAYLRPLEAMPASVLEDDEQALARVNAKPKRSYQNILAGPPGGVPQDAAADATASQAAVVRSAYNVAFEVPGRSDVPSDGADHRVVLRQESLPGTLDYRAAPAIQPAAFLTSVVKAPAKYPLLAGPMRALVEGTYLGIYALPETAPGADLTVPFGLDNRIKIQRVREPQVRGNEGLGGRTKQIAYEFRTTLENLRDQEVTITIEDRVPVSEDERIVVELEKTTTGGHRESVHRPGVLLWNVTLAAHEKKTLVLAYSVRYPKDVVVPGLE